MGQNGRRQAIRHAFSKFLIVPCAHPANRRLAENAPANPGWRLLLSAESGDKRTTALESFGGALHCWTGDGTGGTKDGKRKSDERQTPLRTMPTPNTQRHGDWRQRVALGVETGACPASPPQPFPPERTSAYRVAGDLSPGVPGSWRTNEIIARVFLIRRGLPKRWGAVVVGLDGLEWSGSAGTAPAHAAPEWVPPINFAITDMHVRLRPADFDLHGNSMIPASKLPLR
ncbi:hypothetical protein QBC42DRAFT_272972 [Cladorrhinum samala]|uniref:Uncharacterized protein n=1 Tax=Cladorrhinum samala TaxID=585594 RepID=A0AAV9HHJ1_9PEZI|nr:hypothetical protein QBC42DRAFT_272972 [Cladorrhinum samala]